MKKTLLVTLMLSSLSALATPGVGGCRGIYKGIEVRLDGTMKDKNRAETAEGRLSVDGREVASFTTPDLKYSIIFGTFKLKNAHGDLVEGKVTSIKDKAANLARIHIPAYGIDLRNVQVTCWSR